jgi:diguanylate cyclase (GGDEF)-like protein
MTMRGLDIVEALALALAAREKEGDVRLRRTRAYAVGLARALNLDPPDIEAVDAGALLHDIGKLAVPDDLLAKAEPLAAEELEKIRTHPAASADILATVPLPHSARDAILAHHERWDGAGYPDGLRAEEIPLAARILATAEAFAEIESGGVDPAAAIARLQREAGRSLDPRLVEAFTRCHFEIRAELDAIEHQDDQRLDRRRNAMRDIYVAHMEATARQEVARAVSRSLALPDTMGLLSRTLGALIPHSSLALFVPGDRTGTLVCRIANGVDADRIERLTMHDGEWSARPGSAILYRLPQEQATPADDGGGGIRTVLASALMYPLIFEERFVGLLAVYHTRPGIYTREHERMLGRVCQQAAALIHHSLVFEQTREDSLRDPLTTLPNARFLYVHLERELARARRLNAPVALMVLDLDAFKEINDTHGHQVGDAALRAVADALLGVIRPYDVCIRYAGDEFIVVLPDCGREEGQRKRLDLQKAVEEVRFEVSGRKRLPLAMSVGVAVFPEDGTTWEALLAAADRSMYKDKTRRKGQATRAEPV